MIVMKFGGTSVADAPSMKKVIGIIESHSEKSLLIVLSACSGITDKLMEIVKLASDGKREQASSEISVIESRHNEIIKNLITANSIKSQALQDIAELFSEIRILAEGIALLGELTPKSLDSCIAYGELLSTTVFYHACLDKGLDTSFADARQIMKTDRFYNNATVNFELLSGLASERLRPLLMPGKIIITQGFIGSAPDGSTTTIGRGGSDYSAALFGLALDADEIQIWTDVSGILTADPRLVPQARTLAAISFAEVRELSYYGAKVLHPDTIKPAVNKNIPVRVMNTMLPEHKGTVISDIISKGLSGIHSIVLKQECLFLKYNAVFDENGVNILSRLTAELINYNIKVYGVSANESSLIAIIEKSGLCDDLISSISGINELNKQEVSLLCLCGVIDACTANDVFCLIAHSTAELNPLAVLTGVSENSMLLVFHKEKGVDALKAAHNWLIEDKK